MQFFHPNDPREGGINKEYNNVMLWEFDISASPTSQAIPPCDPDSQDDELDSVLPSSAN